jgi:hypothetical protein
MPDRVSQWKQILILSKCSLFQVFNFFLKKKHRMKVREPKIVCAQDDTAGPITCPKNEKDFFGRTEEVTER